MNPNDALLEKCLSYIDRYWDTIILKPKKHIVQKQVENSVRFLIGKKSQKNPFVLGVPYAAIVPNDAKYKYIFYWDSYFMFRGLLETKHEWVIPSQVENFIYLFKKYHIIPNLSHPESLGRSQPPFLTSMIFDAYAVMAHNTKLTNKIRHLFHSRHSWLRTHMEIAKKEYQEVWQSPMDVDHKHYNHLVEKYQLNRYGNLDVGYAQASEQESGWDMTNRFYNRCHEFLAVDLNCFLYVYETDFARSAGLLANTTEETYWTKTALERKNRMKIFWNSKKGFFYDYDYANHEQSEFESLAGFTPLWAGIATYAQAKECVKKLPLFETQYGLTITTKASLPASINLSQFSKPLQRSIMDVLKPKQWDYPNIWAPLEYLTVIGLLKYGFIDDASRIMKKSLAVHMTNFSKYQTFFEKIDGLTGDAPGTYWYPTQKGFGWTNAIFYRYTRLLEALKEGALPKANNSYPQTLPFTY